jgi:hypothetical protein
MIIQSSSNLEQEVRTSIKDNRQLVFIGAGSTEKGLLPANDLFYHRLTNHYSQIWQSLRLYLEKAI